MTPCSPRCLRSFKQQHDERSVFILHGVIQPSCRHSMCWALLLL